LSSDYKKEEDSLRSIETLLARLEGRADEQPLFNNMAEQFAQRFLTMPRQKLTTIYDLLTYLKSGDWDVTLQERHYSELSEKLKRIVEDIQKVQGDQTLNPYERIDKFVFFYRILLFTFMDIDAFYISVESLCKNFISSTKKLLGETSENFE
jgi:hypothetical protein